MCLAGKKLAIEIPKTIEAADDLADWHFLHAAVTLALGLESAADFVEGNQIVWPPVEVREEFVEKRLRTGPLKIATNLLLRHWWIPIR
jgi:hypothetical protein